MKSSHLLLILVVLFVVLFFPLRTLQFVALLYAAVLGLSFAYAHIISRYVTVRRKDRVLRAHRFDSMEIILIVENRGPLPVPYLNLVDQLPHQSPAGRAEDPQLSHRKPAPGVLQRGTCTDPGQRSPGFVPFSKKMRRQPNLDRISGGPSPNPPQL